MRKTIILLSAIFATFGLFAQDETSFKDETPKQEKMYVPQAGDIAIGIDGDPIFNYLGNMFAGTPNKGLINNGLYFRYFFTDKSAIRVVLEINNSTTINRDYVPDDAARFADPLSQKQLEDVWTNKNLDMNLRIGYQQFRGYRRVLGFYGFDLGYGYGRGNNLYQYGNEMTILNPNPSTGFGLGSPRPLERISRNIHSVFAGVFAGAEYYFLPKICIGTELGLTYGMSFKDQLNSKEELMVGTLHVEQNIADNPGGIGGSSTKTYGRLYFMIHF